MFRRLGEISIPLDQEAEYGRSTPMFVEIGFGNGSFIEHHAQNAADTNCVGAEVSLSSLNRAYKRIRRSGLTNVRLLQCDGEFLVRYVVPPASVAQVAVNFPDPWPRRRHESRRLLSSEFFKLVSSRLMNDGRVCLATDDKDYFEFARVQAQASELFDETILDPPEACLHTRYASKWLAANRSINYVEFQLRDGPEPRESELPGGDMHHAFLTGTLPELTAEEKSIVRVGNAEIVVLDILKKSAPDGYIFIVMVQEEGLRQDILIEVRPHRDGYHVGLIRFGSPILTTGIAEAVRLVAARLEESGMKIEDTWY
ncbi:MAG: tRNA (guanosine(46)-N7)-methyltransferase TrmB [Rhodothermales bacterium]|nr:tRNA (guanosine(46)-N7)-methyltransferase TrmB [Rhodothermales bacterium]